MWPSMLDARPLTASFITAHLEVLIQLESRTSYSDAEWQANFSQLSFTAECFQCFEAWGTLYP